MTVFGVLFYTQKLFKKFFHHPTHCQIRLADIAEGEGYAFCDSAQGEVIPVRTPFPDDDEGILRRFDRLCQMALKGEAINYYKYMDLQTEK